MRAGNSVNPFLKIGLEIGPLAVFFIVYGQYEIFTATAAFMVAVAASMLISWRLTRKIPKMTLVTAIIVFVFGGLTLLLENETFIKLKPTILNGLIAFALTFGLLRGQYYLKTLMEEGAALTDEGWHIFTVRWIWFFAGMAIFNEIVWRTMSTDNWVNIKTFVYFPVTLIFTALQIPLITRYMIDDDDDESSSK